MNTDKNKEKKNENKFFGACKKCGCQSWRTDSDEPPKCINIKAPTKELCGHSEEDHTH